MYLTKIKKYNNLELLYFLFSERLRMCNKKINHILLIVSIISICIFMGCFLKAEKQPLYFNPPAKLIEDYTGLMEGEEVNWVWLKLGTRLRSYPNFTIKPFENRTSLDDQGVTHTIHQGLLNWCKENEIMLSDNGELVCIGAVVELKLDRAFIYDVNPFYEKNDDFFLELELVMKEKNTQETICKIRHGVTGPDINIITEQVLSDVIKYLDLHK